MRIENRGFSIPKTYNDIIFVWKLTLFVANSFHGSQDR